MCRWNLLWQPALVSLFSFKTSVASHEHEFERQNSAQICATPQKLGPLEACRSSLRKSPTTRVQQCRWFTCFKLGWWLKTGFLFFLCERRHRYANRRQFLCFFLRRLPSLVDAASLAQNTTTGTKARIRRQTPRACRHENQDKVNLFRQKYFFDERFWLRPRQEL